MKRLLPALALVALLAVPASAADPAPTPDCHGTSVVDKAGDNVTATDQQQGSPSSDLIAGFITYDGTKAKANIQVDNLTAGEIDAPYVAISWEMSFTTSDGPRFVRGYQDATGMMKWTWGEPRAVTDDQTAPRAGGTTTGALFPGKGGIISIDIPLAEVGAKPGTQFKAIAMQVRQWAGLPSAVPNTGLPLYSYAPIFDDATGKGAVDVKPCAPGQTAPTTTTPTVPTTTPTTVAAGPERLAVTVKVPKLSARKLKKSKSFTIALKGNASGLKAALKKSPTGKFLGTGALKVLKRSGRIKIKLKGKVKKGKYVLYMTGKNANGKPAEGAISLKIRA